MSRVFLLAVLVAATAIALVPAADSSSSHNAATSPRPQIFVIGSNGAGETNITQSASGNDSPSWSPDGTKIAFSSNRDGNWEIYVMNADGSGVTRLTTNRSADDASPVWSPDGSKIAFHTNRDDNYEIYVMNADGSAQTNLTKESGSEDAYPSWAPDGSRIVFASEGDLYTMRADGSQQARLTSGKTDDQFPAWSPDGTKIALAASVGSKTYIDVVNADGTGRTRLTRGGLEVEPRWSKDSSKIAYADFKTGLGHIVVMNADGTGATRLTGAPKRADYDPSWSPDGTKILFAGYVDNVAPAGPRHRTSASAGSQAEGRSPRGPVRRAVPTAGLRPRHDCRPAAEAPAAHRHDADQRAEAAHAAPDRCGPPQGASRAHAQEEGACNDRRSRRRCRRERADADVPGGSQAVAAARQERC